MKPNNQKIALEALISLYGRISPDEFYNTLKQLFIGSLQTESYESLAIRDQERLHKSFLQLSDFFEGCKIPYKNKEKEAFQRLLKKLFSCSAAQHKSDLELLLCFYMESGDINTLKPLDRGAIVWQYMELYNFLINIKQSQFKN